MTTKITEILDGFNEFSENPHKDSIRFLREYLAVEPTSEECIFELGKALFFNKDFKKSIETLKKSRNDKKDAYLGLDYYYLKNYPNAIMHFEKFLKGKENETILIYLMISYEKENEFKKAIDCGERLCEINPKNKSVKVHLIDCHFALRQYEDCLYYIEDLKCKKLKYKKGLVLFKLKRFEDCIRELRGLKTPKSYLLMGKAYEKLDKPSKASRCMYKSYELDGNLETLHELADFNLKNDRTTQTISLLEEILDSDKDNEKALEKMAYMHMREQNPHCAIDYSKRLLKVNANNPAAYKVLSDAYLMVGDRKKSVEIMEKGLEINPKSAKLWIQKAWRHCGDGSDEFEKLFEKALRLEPENIENRTILIRHYAWDSKMEDARRHYDKLLLYNPAFYQSFEEMTRYYTDH